MISIELAQDIGAILPAVLGLVIVFFHARWMRKILTKSRTDVSSEGKREQLH